MLLEQEASSPGRKWKVWLPISDSGLNDDSKNQGVYIVRGANEQADQ